MYPDSPLPSETPTIPLEDRTARESGDPAPITDPAIGLGSVIAGRYRLNAILGEGGTGRVYEAVDMSRPRAGGDGEIIALKVLAPSFDQTAGRFAALQAQFLRWRRLLHPYIVRLFDCERDGSTIYITMENVSGESVYSRLHRGESSGENGRRIVFAVAQALEYAHSHGVVHGDLKPGNVLVDAQEDVKVIDFGLTRSMGRADMATPRYASPQVMDGQKPKPSDDVYSLACVAYEVWTGSHPFDGNTGPPPRRGGLTPREHRALLHALEPEAAARTASIAAFTAELNARSGRLRWVAWPLGLSAVVIAVLAWLAHRPAEKTPPTASMPQVATTASSVIAARTNAEPGAQFRDCPDCPSMTVLPAGRFRQGASDDESDPLPFEKPAHWVQIGLPFAMSTTDITVADFGRFAAATGRDMLGCATYDGDWITRKAASWSKPGFEQSGRNPVTCVSWRDAVAYAAWLSSTSGHSYRLPSASEWEYAARAGSGQLNPWRSDAKSACASANVADHSAEQHFPGWAVFPCDDGYVYTAPAGSFAANAFGLFDMLGNVFVWTEDCWTQDYRDAPTDGSAVNGAPCRERELRGGSWFSAPEAVKASYRNHFADDYRTSSVGFRLVRELH